MRAAWQGWLHTLLWVVIVICLATLSTRFGFTRDWSANSRASITPQSQALLQQLQGPIAVASYAPPGSLRAKTRLLIRRYQRFKPDLKLQFIDPDLDPVATQDAGITANGELVLAWKGQRQHVTTLGERDFSAALIRLARGGTPLVAFITGDGEPDSTGTQPADLGNLVQQLGAHGMHAVPLNLAEAAEVPRNASLVVLANPQAELLPGSVRKLTDYLGNGGNLLWLTEPGSHTLGLAPLAQALGIKRLSGTLVDIGSHRAGFADPRMLVVSRYPAQTITAGFHINTVFPRAAALGALSPAAWNAEPLLQSGPQSWNQSTPHTPGPTALEPGPDALHGPLTFGYALSRVSLSPARNQQRAVVVGDADFLSNAFLTDAGNLAFGERIFNWLLGDDAMANLPPAAPDSVLKPTRLELGVISFGYLLLLPILLILAGMAIAWRRRRR